MRPKLAIPVLVIALDACLISALKRQKRTSAHDHAAHMARQDSHDREHDLYALISFHAPHLAAEELAQFHLHGHTPRTAA